MTATQGHKHPTAHGRPWLKRRIRHLPSEHSPATISRLDQATGTETPEGSMTVTQGHKHPTAHGDGASDERSMLLNMIAEMGDPRSLTPLPPSPPHGGEESKVDQFEVTLPELPSKSPWLAWSPLSVASPSEPETSPPEPVPESTPPPESSQPTRLLEACVQVSREEQLEPATLEEPVVPLASFELPQDAAEGQEHGKEQTAFAPISIPEPGLVLEVTSEPPQPMRLSEAHMQESLDEQQDFEMRDVKELVALSVSSKLPHETAGMLEPVNDTMALASVSAPDLRPVPELTPTSEPPQPTQPSWDSVQEYLEEQLEPFTSSKREQQNLAMEAARELMVTSGSFELPQETAMQLEHAEEAMAPVSISALKPGLLPEVSPLSEASEPRHVLVASTQASLSEELKSAAVSKMELQAPVMEAVEELTMTSASSKLPQDIAGMLEHVAEPRALGAISVQETGLDVLVRSEPPQTAWPPDLFMLSQVAESAARCELKQENLGQEAPVTALPASPELAPAPVLESVALAASSEPVQPTTTALLPQLAESGLSPHPEAAFESEPHPAAAASPAEQRDLGAELPVVCPMTVRTSAAATLTASGTGQLREGTQPAEAAHLPSRARPSREESSSEEAEQSATTGQECPLQPQQMGSVLAALMAIVEKLGQISDNMQLFRNELGLWFRPDLHHPTELRDRRCASCGQEQSSGVAPLLVRGQEVPGQEQHSHDEMHNGRTLEVAPPTKRRHSVHQMSEGGPFNGLEEEEEVCRKRSRPEIVSLTSPLTPPHSVPERLSREASPIPAPRLSKHSRLPRPVEVQETSPIPAPRLSKDSRLPRPVEVQEASPTPASQLTDNSCLPRPVEVQEASPTLASQLNDNSCLPRPVEVQEASPTPASQLNDNSCLPRPVEVQEASPTLVPRLIEKSCLPRPVEVQEGKREEAFAYMQFLQSPAHAQLGELALSEISLSKEVRAFLDQLRTLASLSEQSDSVAVLVSNTEHNTFLCAVLTLLSRCKTNLIVKFCQGKCKAPLFTKMENLLLIAMAHAAPDRQAALLFVLIARFCSIWQPKSLLPQAAYVRFMFALCRSLGERAVARDMIWELMRSDRASFLVASAVGAWPGLFDALSPGPVRNVISYVLHRCPSNELSDTLLSYCKTVLDKLGPLPCFDGNLYPLVDDLLHPLLTTHECMDTCLELRKALEEICRRSPNSILPWVLRKQLLPLLQSLLSKLQLPLAQQHATCLIRLLGPLWEESKKFPKRLDPLLEQMADCLAHCGSPLRGAIIEAFKRLPGFQKSRWPAELSYWFLHWNRS
ncbi:uncharacterized protein LOC144111944 isoform X1 [Amblyomma americanum]